MGRRTITKPPTVTSLRYEAEQNPTYSNLIDLSSAQRRTGQLFEAIETLGRALKLDPDEPAGWNSAAQVNTDLGFFNKVPDLFKTALMCYEKKGPEALMSGQARVTLLGFATSLLRLGMFEYAWPIWEAARIRSTWEPFPGLVPWKGETNIRKLLVMAEGGFGDGFFFSRWMKELPTGTTVLIWDHLADYYSHILPKVTFLPMGSYQFQYGELSQYSHCTGLMSLPAALGMQSWIDIPPAPDWTPPGTIIAPPQDWIGFCWRAEEIGVQRPIRSLDQFTADKIARLLVLESDLVISLCPTKRGVSNDKNPVRIPKGVQHDQEMLSSWERTAQTILKCKLVVTIDTAIVHLAGSLKVPTILLLPVRSDWKWGMPGEPARWYPRCDIVRSTDPKGWTGVVDDVKKLLG